MKVYLETNSVTLVGKAWQVRYLLKKYMQEYETVQDWIEGRQKENVAKPSLEYKK
ncbi:Z-ring formation inhibitor MciZ [Bacillus sp. Marseille-Q3570]|uniref:Z-ring formation inhibitor MciZ n=1 Tax=Bacillus sp. Marseille-Q3570 TaxID=2963522 RepID=UPI0021B8114A|nr:Z-ring formation inhibitor MciZ [Bacillus sp. Marseille-Q3570]